MKKILIFFVCICVLLFIGAFVVTKNLGPVTDTEHVYTYDFSVPSGMSIREVGHVLKEQHMIYSEHLFYAIARYTHAVLKSGNYTIRSDMSMREIFALLGTGAPEQIHLVIPEGLTLHKIANRLETVEVCSTDAFLSSAHSLALMKKYDITADSFEGYLFPDTYYVVRNMDADDVVDRMVSNFFTHVQQIPSLQKLSSEELKQKVILASIIEREYQRPEEAPLIASVFTNRLKQDIGLYSCATIEYILTEIQGKEHPDVITYEDLKIDNPYNTYKWRGLPPGPISNPGMVALKAAADPAQTNYYYFRLTGDGTHSFSKDFQTHITEGNKLYTKTAAGR
ncbi:MAG: endolytic transglycosylase MltG [Treponema sp.]|nr:endolytic transglycosylase MltG [Treponema sp.]